MYKLIECEERTKILHSGIGFSHCSNRYCPLHKPTDQCRLWRECEVGKSYCCLKCQKDFTMDKVC